MQDDIAKGLTIPKSIFWLLALWVVVVLFALVWGIGNAETTLLADARASLAEAGYDVAVDVSGRDARLIGSVISEDVAADIAESIDALAGVRAVENELEILEPPAPVAGEPQVEFRIIGDAVSLHGTVPSVEIEQALVTAAEEQFGAGLVVNAITVSEDVATPPWMGRIRDILQHLGGLRSGGFVATDAGLEISGEVISEVVRAHLLQEISLVIDDTLPVSADLAIAVLPSPLFSATGSGGLVTLDGILPNQETIDQIAEAAQRLHEGKTIINSLDTGEVAGPVWLEVVPGLLDIVTRLDPWTLDVSEGNATITGLALEQDLVAGIDVLAQEVGAGELTVTTRVQVNPATVAIQLTDLLAGSTAFESNATRLSAEGMALLDAALAILNANPSALVVVEGYTDNQGDQAANLLLSQQRAEAVVTFLVSGGVAEGRLSAIGYGEENPIASNSTDEGRAQNRRIEFVIQEGDG